MGIGIQLLQNINRYSSGTGGTGTTTNPAPPPVDSGGTGTGTPGGTGTGTPGSGDNKRSGINYSAGGIPWLWEVPEDWNVTTNMRGQQHAWIPGYEDEMLFTRQWQDGFGRNADIPLDAWYASPIVRNDSNLGQLGIDKFREKILGDFFVPAMKAWGPVLAIASAGGTSVLGDLAASMAGSEAALSEGAGIAAGMLDAANTFSPEMLGLGAAAGGAASGMGMMPAAVPEIDPTFGGILEQTGPGQFENVANIGAFGAVGSAPAVTPPSAFDQAKHVFDQGKKVYDQVKGVVGSEVPQGAPQQGDQSNEQYAQQLIDYIGLDGQALADMGLVPGTDDYYQYIMREVDSMMESLLGGLDMNAADFSQQIRSKTAEEQAQLQRALYVRGQLDQLMGSGRYTDPFTGQEQDVIAPEGMLFNPSRGAYHRGLAGQFSDMAGMGAPEALQSVQEFLGRDADLFGMQERADERFEQAKLEDDLRRRRGMLGY